ncbi:MAG TPA: hypothetical protein V6C65_10715 [Allocoleopsis sp.]
MMHLPLFPLICFVLGILILLVIGSGLLRAEGGGLRKGDILRLLVGYGAVAIALMLGLIGYVDHLNAEVLRFVRLFMILAGFAILGYQFIESQSRP